MGLIVQKFGGSSVRDRERLLRAMRIVRRTWEQGDDVVVVLSAQGDTTDALLARARELTEEPPLRELDALLKDNPGVLSNVLSIFAGSGANILTINQSIPTNGCAAVTISAETSDMRESLEELIASAAETAGVVKFEILAG